jgi:hypothetical protein
MGREQIVLKFGRTNQSKSRIKTQGTVNELLQGVLLNKFDIIMVNSESMLFILVLISNETRKQKRSLFCFCFKTLCFIQNLLYTFFSD